MTWFPPHIELCHSMSARRSMTLLAFVASLCGCTSLPSIRSMSVADSSQALPGVKGHIPPVMPDFDIGPAVPIENVAAEKVAVASPDVPVPKAEHTGTIEAPKPVQATVKASPSPPEKAILPEKTTLAPAVESAQVGQNATDSVAVAPKDLNSEAPVVQQEMSAPVPVPSTVTAAPVKEELKKPAATALEPVKVATAKVDGVLVNPPASFHWEQDGKSTGGRPFQKASPGEDGYRTLVVGSVGGNDPLALELVELLAKRLHDDSVILGGFDCTIVRTLNPDGEANKNYLNEKEQYINDFFPKPGDKVAVESPAEVRYLLDLLKDVQPQRVVHIRSVKGAAGIIAANESCQPAAKEAAEWLKFKQAMLPSKGSMASTMERYISTSGNSDMIMFAIPQTTPQAELWERYGDTLLNLLLGDDIGARELARQQSKESSAERAKESSDK